MKNLIKSGRGKFIIGVLVAVIIIGVIITNMNKTTNTNVSSDHHVAVLETSYGVITLELYNKEMPITAGNFEKLVSSGFYNNIIFHRIINGFMIQGGDPDGTGEGGPGYTIKDEFTKTDLDKNNRGTIAMAKTSAPNSAGSQFFINLVNNDFLNNGYSVFGKVISGMEVVDKIAKVETNQNDKPLKDVKIIKVVYK